MHVTRITCKYRHPKGQIGNQRLVIILSQHHLVRPHEVVKYFRLVLLELLFLLFLLQVFLAVKGQNYCFVLGLLTTLASAAVAFLKALAKFFTLSTGGGLETLLLWMVGEAVEEEVATLKTLVAELVLALEELQCCSPSSGAIAFSSLVVVIARLGPQPPANSPVGTQADANYP